MSKPVYHVAIVGAGLGGLAAAIAISQAGHRVTVIEQAHQLGEVSHSLPKYLDCCSRTSGRSWYSDSAKFRKDIEEVGCIARHRGLFRAT